MGDRISVSRRQRGASLHGYVSVVFTRYRHSNGLLHASSPARPLSSRRAASPAADLKKRHGASAPTNIPHPTSRTHPIPHSLSFFLIPHEHHVTLPCSLPPSRTPLHSIVYRPSRVGYDVPAHSCQLTGPLSQRASCARVRSYDPTSPSWPTTTT